MNSELTEKTDIKEWQSLDQLGRLASGSVEPTLRPGSPTGRKRARREIRPRIALITRIEAPMVSRKAAKALRFEPELRPFDVPVLFASWRLGVKTSMLVFQVFRSPNH